MPFKNPHPLYSTWQGIRRRCLNPNHRQWNDYGGRGITICSRWNDFHAFVEDMGPRPDGYTLDRIDNDLGYFPENCRWASRKTQQRNQRKTRYVVIEGKKYLAAKLSDISGHKTETIVERARSGLSYEDVMAPDRRVYKEGLALGGLANGRRQRRKTHCPQGHEYTAENTLLSKEGWRRCRVCFYTKERRRLAKKRSSL